MKPTSSLKIDGTNGAVWLSEGEVQAGSRRRHLSSEADNAGFYEFAINSKELKSYLMEYPSHRLYGEWLVPHSLRTYREDAWRDFYVFDVAIEVDHELVYLPYSVYQKQLERYGINYIPPLGIVRDSSYEQLVHYLEANDYLIEDGKGNGEGIVIKNYEYQNQYGRTTWAKIVTSEFKEKHTKAMGAPQIANEGLVEEKIVASLCTEAFIEKEYVKLELQLGGFSSRDIPRLLSQIYYEFINEEAWQMVKKFKNPTINFKILNSLVIEKVKSVKHDLF